MRFYKKSTGEYVGMFREYLRNPQGEVIAYGVSVKPDEVVYYIPVAMLDEYTMLEMSVVGEC